MMKELYVAGQTNTVRGSGITWKILLTAMTIFAIACEKAVDNRGVRAIPIVAAKASVGNLPVILTGLGTVTPTDVVTVKTRVSGHLISVGFREGQMVNQGDLLAEIDSRPYEVQLMQAEGQLARNNALYFNAQQDLDRYKDLNDKGVISSQLLDTQTAQTEQLAAALRSDEGSVESAKLNLEYCRITAPVSGRLGLRYVDPGNLVNPSDSNGIVVITPLAPIHVLFSIPADSINTVIKKDYHNLVVEAWDRDSTSKLATGKLWAIDNQVDPATGTVKLKGLFENRDSLLFPNQFVNVRLFVDTIRNAVLIPSAAIQRGPQGTFVFVVNDESEVELRLVEIRASQGDQTALSAGLEVGETVVTEGIERLREGSRVTIPGMDSPNGGGNSGGSQRQGRSGS
ncbi:MAG: MdtA/MuxA family multidrug efflux RND transporter periplasmic adaptor subunit [Holophagaceae bacterium]|nr:MdtA/MuxA family multidrug efflux RND transporter periplasmic adaptor subunit [Holophagaceae bacterium]